MQDSLVVEEGMMVHFHVVPLPHPSSQAWLRVNKQVQKHILRRVIEISILGNLLAIFVRGSFLTVP